MTDATGLDTARLTSIFGAMPAAVAVLRGPEHVFEYTNERYDRLVGRRLVGRNVREALPEIEGQGFFELLDRVYSTGEPYVGEETLVEIDRQGTGELEREYLNFVYTPIRGVGGAVDSIFVHAVEVTELVRSRQQVEELAGELEDERARIEAVFEQLPAGVVIAEAPTGRLLRANRNWRETFGIPHGEVDDVASHAGFTGLHLDGRRNEADDGPLARAIETGEPANGEIELVLGRGERRWLSISAGPIHDAGGNVVAGVAAVFDVSERRRAGALLEAHQGILQLVAQGAPLAETLERLSRMIEERSEHGALASILLLDGEHLRHGAAPSLAPAYVAVIDGIVKGEAVGSCGTAAHRAAQVVVEDIATDPLWHDFRDLALEHGLRACWSTPIVSTQDEVLGTFAVYYSEPSPPGEHDIGLVQLATRTAALAIERDRLEHERAGLFESERAARAEAESRAQASVSLAYVADGVALLDRDGVVRLLNPAAADLLELESRRAVGRRLVDVFPGWQAVLDQTGGARRATRTVPVERGGVEAWLSVSAVDFPGGTVYAFRDVTDEHRLEELRADLVATVSHELRTPLASVYGAAMTLQRSALDADVVPTLVQLIGSEAERLRGLVDEILLASRLEAGGAFEIQIGRFDAAELARSVVEPLAPRAALDVEGPLPVDADATRARQVLENLVDNALKYGGDGPVRIGVERAGDRVRFSVADRGPGVPRRQQTRIFEKFFRLDPDLVRGIGGTGLGLYIARELVERMGGRIWVESDEGRGATFAFELPAAH